MTSLLQDIPVFNGYDTTYLEDWLVDTETAADLMAERGTKLAQAKSEGFNMHLNHRSYASGNPWDDIKDLLWFKNL